MTTPTATIFLPYHALDDVILRGTRAAQPAASAVVPGTLYAVTDEGNLVERSNGTTWEAYSPTGGGGGAPAAHHVTHEPGGSDALVGAAWLATANVFTADQTITESPPRLKLYDTGQPANLHLFDVINQAATLRLRAVNDAENSVVEPLVLDRSGSATVGNNLTVNGSGGNVALLTAANTFLTPQTVSGSPAAQVRLIDPSQVVNARMFLLSNTGGQLYLLPTTDTGIGAAPYGIQIDRVHNLHVGADLYEKGRATPMGHWIDVAFSAGNFATNTGAWTVVAGNVNFNRYTLIGKTMFWYLELGGTSHPACNYLVIVVPGAPTVAAVCGVRCVRALINGVAVPELGTSGAMGPGYLSLGLPGGGALAAASGNTSLGVTAILSLA